MNQKYRCRVCSSTDNVNFGSLPEQEYFAGTNIKGKFSASFLYKCNSCNLLLRDPILSTSQYNTLYSKASSNVWSKHDAKKNIRHDQDLVKNFILKRKKDQTSVLDVGCYTGELLNSLPANYLKYGVEMSDEAAAEAKAKGIKIIGNDLYNINSNERFDLIIAVDVIEHTPNPEQFISMLSLLLHPQGEIIISTGNTDNWLWRNLKNRFWYCKFYEHISFVGKKWLDLFCQKNKFVITDIVYFCYVPTKPAMLIKNLLKLFLTFLAVLPERFSNTTKDHFCFVIKKIN